MAANGVGSPVWLAGQSRPGPRGKGPKGRCSDGLALNSYGELLGVLPIHNHFQFPVAALSLCFGA